MLDMPVIAKNIAVPFILAAFLMVVFFGFAAMSYGPDGRMQGDCPFSAAGVTPCPQNALAAAMHHIAAYQSFFNVPVDFGISALIVALYAIGVALALLASRVCIPTAPARVWYESPSAVSYNKKLTRWLSLFEHSPSRW